MPFRNIPDTKTRYGLISFDTNGEERRDDPDGLMSRCLLDIARDEGITNVFLFSHGWKGDMPAAIEQYNKWIGAFDNLAADRARAATVFPNFQPLYIGLHWPSLPWGDEEIGDGSFAAADDETPGLGRDGLFQLYLDRLGDTPEIRAALGTILDEGRRVRPGQLPPVINEAFLDLERALELSAEGAGGGPDADREPFDPAAAFENSEEVSFGAASSFVIGLLQQVSFWTMKKRARKIGEGGMHDFVVSLQRATGAAKTRVHLMGHSFGCIVTSSILHGKNGAQLNRPVDSVVLVQGALSLWSWAVAIPFDRLGSGYFHQTFHEGRIRGPLVTTQSVHDSAVGRLYPMASQISRDVVFAAEELPKFGAVGTWGLQGLPDEVRTERPMLPADGEYGFQPGHIYNLESSGYIRKMDGISGAHSDIAGPEVAHAIWQAAMAPA